MLAAGLSECLQQSELEADSDLAAQESIGFGRLSRYELVEEIARGGMGVVYRARDTTLSRTVALKMIVTGQFASEREVKRFRAEAEAAARLDHSNIVPIYEVGEEDGRPFFSMKFMEGGTLTARLAGGKSPFTQREAAGLLVKIARAVHHAHQHAILHRDIKPGNILLDANGEPHVSDFGLAKSLDSGDKLTLSGAMLGSPSYMSPEQAAGHSERLTTASDTYSLGALLYELITGRPPFQAATPLATMEKVLREEPPRPRALRAEIDRDLETICLKCLEKEPSRRYGSAETLADDLERWLRHEPIRARPSKPIERLRKWIRRQPGIALLTLVALLAIIEFVLGQTILRIRVNRANTEVRATNKLLAASLYECSPHMLSRFSNRSMQMERVSSASNAVLFR
jgi:serine/threonine-protein kinase